MGKFNHEVMEAVKTIENEYNLEFSREYLKLHKNIVNSCARGLIEDLDEVTIEIKAVGLIRNNVTIEKLRYNLIDSGIPSFTTELIDDKLYLTIDITSIK